jgi:hypothetical protein
MTELESCVVLVALLLLSQRYTVSVMSLLYSYGLRKAAKEFLLDECENINTTLCVVG